MTMIMTAAGELTTSEMERLVDFLMDRLDADDRRDLMATQPVTYAKMHPGVDHAVILAAVGRALNQVAGARKVAVAAEQGGQERFCSNCGMLDEPGVHTDRACPRYAEEIDPATTPPPWERDEAR
jgi:hypothetical protein